ncbi:SpoIIAA family protein [Alienimonas californiensis]|uniref:STAS/SEC14 domain-containing protein n=1 Tax=Alienimonas californiensis TaxID=2527989 RepID=A0A517P8M7_9PLAN|nr:STAS/SEC14 domain-containing protein [Alienimonas californiensis]QDT15728.1 hypothetical protein CA12_18190 [Alienimonas californiensis]
MSYHVTEDPDGNVLEVRVSGTLSAEAYDRFVPQTEALIEKYGKVRMLVELRDFHGWDAGALWKDVKFDLKHFNDLERLAIVGDSKWEKGMSAFCKPFTTATVKYFDTSELAAAKAWIREG